MTSLECGCRLNVGSHTWRIIAAAPVLPPNMRAVLIASVSLLAGAVVSPGAAIAKTANACDRGHGRTVVRTTQAVRILRLKSGVVRACSRTTRKSRLLVSDPDTQDSTILAIREQFVADQLFVTDRGNEYAVKIRVLNVATGRFRIVTDAFMGSCCVHPATTQHTRGVRSAAIGSTGNVAWISSRIEPDASLEVRYATTSEDSRLLDTDATVEPTSIALGDKYVYWARASGPQSYSLAL